ncbi:hypothetical protein P376_1484 [Streptomyces sp. HCCB10043]|nr:hypothetical protein P376_1484 [Streptomyces sp. HCCB10043]
MDHRVDGVLRQDPRYGRLPDVGADELRVAQLMRGRDRVDRDHPVHPGIALDAPDEAAPQLPGHSCDEDDLPQDQRLPSAWEAEPCFPVPLLPAVTSLAVTVAGGRRPVTPPCPETHRSPPAGTAGGLRISRTAFAYFLLRR